MIILYSNGCPRCRVLEQKLDLKNIEYEKHSDIDEMMDMGIMSTPVLSVDGNILQFKEANDWINEQEGQNED